MALGWRLGPTLSICDPKCYCLGGVWGHSQQRNILEAEDIDEGLRAAAAVGKRHGLECHGVSIAEAIAKNRRKL